MAAPAAALTEDGKHKLQNEWAMWELRKKDRESGIGVKDWNELPLKLYTFKTVEDFWMCWKRTPQITDVFDDGLREPPKVEREDERDVPRKGQPVRTQAEAYMLFKEGIRPVTEFEVTPGVRATKGRRRAELAVRSKEFKKYAEAWETTVLALIGEQVDPDNFVNGVYLQDKHARNTTALRLDVWFSTDDDQIMDYICEELRLLLKKACPDLPFRFGKIAKRGGGGGAK